jgi:hypothetical protein
MLAPDFLVFCSCYLCQLKEMRELVDVALYSGPLFVDAYLQTGLRNAITFNLDSDRRHSVLIAIKLNHICLRLS